MKKVYAFRLSPWSLELVNLTRVTRCKIYFALCHHYRYVRVLSKFNLTAVCPTSLRNRFGDFAEIVPLRVQRCVWITSHGVLGMIWQPRWEQSALRWQVSVSSGHGGVETLADWRRRWRIPLLAPSPPLLSSIHTSSDNIIKQLQSLLLRVLFSLSPGSHLLLSLNSTIAVRW